MPKGDSPSSMAMAMALTINRTSLPNMRWSCRDRDRGTKMGDDGSWRIAGASGRSRWLRLIDALVNYKGEWVDDHRGSLMTVATLIATITFQAAIVPPGGVWQQLTINDPYSNCTKARPCIAGNAVLAYAPGNFFSIFMLLNAVAFMGSMSVLFLLVSGFPPKNKLCLWILTVAVCITVSFLGFSFMVGMALVLPDETIGRLKSVFVGSFFSWVGLVAVLVLTNIIILLGRIIRCCKKKCFLTQGSQSIAA